MNTTINKLLIGSNDGRFSKFNKYCFWLAFLSISSILAPLYIFYFVLLGTPYLFYNVVRIHKLHKLQKQRLAIIDYERFIKNENQPKLENTTTTNN